MSARVSQRETVTGLRDQLAAVRRSLGIDLAPLQTPRAAKARLAAYNHAAKAHEKLGELLDETLPDEPRRAVRG